MTKTFNELFEEAKKKDEYWERWLVGDFIDSLSSRMETLGISRAELAQRLGTSAAYVTKVLRGETNLTVQSMAKLAKALDGVVRIHVAQIGSTTRFIDIFSGDRLASVYSGNQYSSMILDRKVSIRRSLDFMADTASVASSNG